jgi:selenocysteine lyase/cysteine desulfurase
MAKSCAWAPLTSKETIAPFSGAWVDVRDIDCDFYAVTGHKLYGPTGVAGTPPIVQAIGLAAALDYIDSIGKSRIRAHETALTVFAHERLRGRRANARCA